MIRLILIKSEWLHNEILSKKIVFIYEERGTGRFCIRYSMLIPQIVNCLLSPTLGIRDINGIFKCQMHATLRAVIRLMQPGLLGVFRWCSETCTQYFEKLGTVDVGRVAMFKTKSYEYPEPLSERSVYAIRPELDLMNHVGRGRRGNSSCPGQYGHGI